MDTFPFCKVCGVEITHRFPSQVRTRKYCSRACWGKSKLGEHRVEFRVEDSPVLAVWRGMIRRCYQPSNKDYKQYGGRGIQVCSAWRGSIWVFHAWAEHTGYRPGLSIDRINNTGDYTPENCRWATPQQQARNRRGNSPVTAFGETKLMCEWLEDPRCRCGTGRKGASVLVSRLYKQGLSPEVAISAKLVPLGHRNKQKPGLI